ncbi:phopshatase [Leishmania donovani]|uniref:Phopshatase_-_putative n=3 Tax=Leishmania donovani species complex TaxID=38574 RepID=A0A6L0XMB7_LEIIN|nr:putative phopshatase [Leishmania infantum JPCM5]TPP40612.1 Dual specificity phosphatase, catalytic domain family protein [Leishmania donovani]CAC9501647.1 phopshatase_-_putative [Leishmania infantum]CAJ1990158.1 phopshatase [Leishmania donovani]CAM69244.1 putative phopshatase [Leishmania infantum JPCM5]SUZ43179.1 phopshatase_-_putative [Leishmania infantum]|eukprot:XP_001470052.1 putative phopshatase [Leishmania infantum JPCM5]
MSNCPPASSFCDFGEWKSEEDDSEDSCSSDFSSSSSAPYVVCAQSISFATGALGKAQRKLSALPLSDTDEELRAEIEQSRLSLECNLSALRLSAVPSDVPLQILRKISLSENKLVSLPDGLFLNGSFGALVELVLNTNLLTSLPLSLFYLPHLQVLSVNNNSLTSLPFENVIGAERDAAGDPFLPSVRRIGMESNQLQLLPLSLLEWCPSLEELFLAMNEAMLDEPVSYDRLQRIRRLSTKRVVLRVDNRPRFVRQIEAQCWARTLPWLQVELNKIYPDKVLDYLFLGSLRTAQTVTVYHDLDICYVLTVGRDLEAVIEPWMQQLVLPVNDFPEQSMVPVFDDAFRFIDEARSHKKGVLIHCFAGLSRSVTIAVAYLMHLKGITRDDALALVRLARPAAQPNDGFLRELGAYEEMLRSRCVSRE